MSQTSSHADPRLAHVVEALRAEEAALQVVAARIYTVPYMDVHVIVEVREDRQFNILEEFILRAAHELQPRPTLEGLAGMLGLDPLFVEASWRKLDAMRAVALGAGQTVELTDRGREYYLQGQLPPVSLEEEFDLRYWFVGDSLVPAGRIPRSPAPDPVLPGCDPEDDDEQISSLAGVMSDVQRIISFTSDAGMGLHQPEEGRGIHAVSNWRIVTTGVAPVALLVVQDTHTDAGGEARLSLRMFDPVSGRRDFASEATLQRWLKDGRVTLRDFVPTEGDYREVLEDAQHTLLIGLPGRISETVGDELIGLLGTLAERNVVTILGWGGEFGQETPEPDSSSPLFDRLHGITTSLGGPAAVAIRAGEQHSTDVYVDGRTLVSGAGRWLSGSGGMVDCETDAEVVEPALRDFEQGLVGAASRRWQTLVAEISEADAGDMPQAAETGLAQCCVIWAAARHYQEALQQIVELVDVIPAVLPVAFRLMTVTLVTLLRLPDEHLKAQVDIDLLREAVIDIDTRFGDVPEELYAAEQKRLDETWRALRRRLSEYEH